MSDGLTYLDIVKHAVKAVMHMLGPHDAVALVKLADAASTVLARQLY